MICENENLNEAIIYDVLYNLKHNIINNDSILYLKHNIIIIESKNSSLWN